MPRLSPCPACGRHVRVSEPACPFCGSARATAAAPARLTVALVGLCLAACTPSNDAPTKPGNQNPEPDTAPVEPVDTAAPEVDPTPEPEPTPEPTPMDETTGAEPGETGSVGTDDGSEVEEEPVAKPKYGAPRPKQKYGAPRPKPKYGAAPLPDDSF